MSEREGSGSNFMAFLAGSAVGAIAGTLTGIFMAPKSGKETREHLVQTAEQWAEKARYAADRAKHAAEAAYDRSLGTVKEGRELAETQILAAKAAIKAGREAWQEVRQNDNGA